MKALDRWLIAQEHAHLTVFVIAEVIGALLVVAIVAVVAYSLWQHPW